MGSEEEKIERFEELLDEVEAADEIIDFSRTGVVAQRNGNRFTCYICEQVYDREVIHFSVWLDTGEVSWRISKTKLPTICCGCKGEIKEIRPGVFVDLYGKLEKMIIAKKVDQL